MNDNRKSINPNRTRDHLANERTYLSWIRTAIALLGFGLLVLKLRPLVPADSLSQSRAHGWELGAAFALVGLLLVPLANRRYFQVMKAIEDDDFTPSRRAISWSSAAVFIIGLGVLLYLLFSSLPMDS